MLVGEARQGLWEAGGRPSLTRCGPGAVLDASKTRPLDTVSASLTRSLGLPQGHRGCSVAPRAMGFVALEQEGPCPASEKEGLT